MKSHEKQNYSVFFTDNIPFKYKIKLYGHLDTIDSLRIADLQKKYLVYLQSMGYISASVDSVRIAENNVNLYFYCGKRFYWISVLPEQSQVDLIRKAGINLRYFRGQPVRPAKIVALKKKLLTYLENNGYPFAAVQLNPVTIQDSLFQAVLNVELYGRFYFDSLIVKGNPAITQNYLRHFLEIQKGVLYREKILQMIPERLNQLEFIDVIRPWQVSFNHGKADTYLFLKSRSANRFNGIIGILPNPQNQGKVLFTGEAELFLLNAFRHGEEMFFLWKKPEPLTQKLNTGFQYPYLFSSNMGIDFNLSLYKKDTSYLTVNPVYGVCLYSGGGNYFKVFINHKSSNMLSPFSNMRDSVWIGNFAGYNCVIYGLGTRQQHLDYRFNPSKGYTIFFSTGIGTKSVFFKNVIGENSKFSARQVESELDASIYFPLAIKNTLKIGNKTGLLYDFELNKIDTGKSYFYENELFRFGGVNSLRGFDEDALTASAYSIFTVEYRYLFEKNSNFFVFCDGAYYEKKAIKFVSDYPLGFGAGISFETRSGIFTLSYALGKQFNNPIDIRTAKIHIGFINRF